MPQRVRNYWPPDTTTTKANGGRNAVARKKPEKPKAEAVKLKTCIDRIIENDETAAPEFREFLKKNPDYVDMFGNAARDAERTLMKRVGGESLLIREIHTAKLAELRSRVGRPQTEPD